MACLLTIRSDESEIRGDWITVGGQVVGDANTERIEALLKEHLQEVGRDRSGWETLYVDPNGGRFWEHTYPQSEMHGGGPPLLRHVTAEDARQKYHIPRDILPR